MATVVLVFLGVVYVLWRARKAVEIRLRPRRERDRLAAARELRDSTTAAVIAARRRRRAWRA